METEVATTTEFVYGNLVDTQQVIRHEYRIETDLLDPIIFPICFFLWILIIERIIKWIKNLIT